MNKYKNQKCTVNGIEFDSKKEARRYGELLLMERAGTITGLQRQVTFELIPKQKDPDGGYVHPAKYIADFVYYDRECMRTVVEDVKGIRTAAYTLKKKLMLYVHGIKIQEV